MKLIDFSITFIFTILNICILFFILRAILFKPVGKFIEARTAKIKGDIESAAQINQEAKMLKTDYEEKMRAAEENARQIAETVRKNAEERSAAIIAEAKAQAEALVAAARTQIAAERAAAYEEFSKEASELVVQAAGRVLEKELSAEERKRWTALAVEDMRQERQAG